MGRAHRLHTWLGRLARVCRGCCGRVGPGTMEHGSNTRQSSVPAPDHDGAPPEAARHPQGRCCNGPWYPAPACHHGGARCDRGGMITRTSLGGLSTAQSAHSNGPDEGGIYKDVSAGLPASLVSFPERGNPLRCQVPARGLGRYSWPRGLAGCDRHCRKPRRGANELVGHPSRYGPARYNSP
jgi:hypothetical protein